MSPTQIIVGLMVLGVLVLLVAPTLHRRSTNKSRVARRDQRLERVAELRQQGRTAEYRMSGTQAARARDALLLQGVRAELDSDSESSLLIVDREDAEACEKALTQIGIEKRRT